MTADDSSWRSRRDEAWRRIGGAARRFREHELGDRAAALTYYSTLSVFPALIVLVSVLGLLGQGTTDSLLHNLKELAPGPARDVLVSAIGDLRGHDTTAGILLVAGVVTALWSASAYIGGFIRAANVVWEVREKRRFYQTIPLRVGITILLLALPALAAVAVVFTGPAAEQLRQVVGLGRGGTILWDLLKWPVVALIAATALGVLYGLAPDVGRRRLKILTPGSVLAVALWLLASAAFSLYVANFGSYNKTYGGLAGVVVFLIWLWLTNMAVLLGLELDAELSRFRRAHGRAPGPRPRSSG